MVYIRGQLIVGLVELLYFVVVLRKTPSSSGPQSDYIWVQRWSNESFTTADSGGNTRHHFRMIITTSTTMNHVRR